MDLATAIAAVPDAVALDDLPDAWKWLHGKTNSYGSTAALSTDQKYVFQCYAHDSYNEGLAHAIVVFAREHEAELIAPPERLFTPVEGFAADGYQFDTLVAVSPAIHRNHEENPELRQATRAVFPAYRCEVSGNEDEEQAHFRYARANGIRATGWNREPDPYLRMRYRAANGEEIPQLGFTRPKSIVIQLRRLPDRPDGFIEFENYQQRVWRVTWDEAWLVNEEGQEESRMDFDEAVEFVKQSLLGPNRAAGESKFGQ